MIKSELITQLTEENPHLFQRDIERIVANIFEDITKALEDGGRVELRGFGAFSVRHRAPRIGRNPKSGESVKVAAKSVPFFKAGKELRQRVDASMGS